MQNLIPEMLQDMRDNRCGSPGYLGENYTNEEGILVNDTCHEEWDKILDHIKEKLAVGINGPRGARE